MLNIKDFNSFFSDKFINKGASKNNIVVYFLGRLTYPMSLIFSKMGVTPNQITTLSTFFAILSAIALVYSDNYVLFMTFWSISSLLDFCDGTLARMTGQVRATAFRYDHTSDLFKIFVIILSVAIRFDDIVLWVISMLSIFLFMFYGVLSYELEYVKKSIQKNVNEKVDIKPFKKSQASSSLLFLKNIYFIVFTIKGHTLLLFLLFSLGKEWAIFFLIYFSLLSIISVFVNITSRRSLSKG